MSKFFVRDNELHSGIHGLSRSMFSNNLEMIVERGFPLLRKINSIIYTMREMGMMAKFNDDFIHNKTILLRIRNAAEMYRKDNSKYENASHDENVVYDDDAENSQDDDPRVVLSIEHLEGGFTLLLAGYLVSAIIFVLEILSEMKFIKKCVRFAKRLFFNRCKKKIKIVTKKMKKNKNKKRKDTKMLIMPKSQLLLIRRERARKRIAKREPMNFG